MRALRSDKDWSWLPAPMTVSRHAGMRTPPKEIRRLLGTSKPVICSKLNKHAGILVESARPRPSALPVLLAPFDLSVARPAAPAMPPTRHPPAPGGTVGSNACPTCYPTLLPAPAVLPLHAPTPQAPRKSARQQQLAPGHKVCLRPPPGCTCRAGGPSPMTY